jgi:hypothetical protein
MRPLLLFVVATLAFCSASLAQEPAFRSPLDNSPVEWFLDDWPIPDVMGSGIRSVKFYNNLAQEADPGVLSASNRRFVLKRAQEPTVEMQFDSVGHLLHAVHNKYSVNQLDSLEVHLEQQFDENGQMGWRIDRRISLGRMWTLSRDTTFYTYDKKGRPASLRIPHRPYTTGSGDPILEATSKLSEYVYNRKGRLTKLVKRCDPSSNGPSGMLVVCAQDSFLYDSENRLVEILQKDVSGWETARHFLYDAQNRLKETAVYAGRNPYVYLRWQYNAANLPIECVQESASGFTPPRIMTFGYDADGILNRFQVRIGADRIEADWVVEVE